MNSLFSSNDTTSLFYIFLRIASKNEKKYLVIHHQKIYFDEFFRMSKSIRELWRRKLLIIDFFPCYLNGKFRALVPIQNSRFWPLYNYDSVIFLTQTYYLSTAGRVKLELGNNERPIVHVHYPRHSLNFDSVSTLCL